MVRRRSFSSSVQRRHILDRCRSIFIHYASTRPAGRLESLSPAATPASQYNEDQRNNAFRSEEHTSELQSLMRISYAVFCLKKKKKTQTDSTLQYNNQTYTQNKTTII